MMYKVRWIWSIVCVCGGAGCAVHNISELVFPSVRWDNNVNNACLLIHGGFPVWSCLQQGSMNGKGVEFALATQVFDWATLDSAKVFSLESSPLSRSLGSRNWCLWKKWNSNAAVSVCPSPSYFQGWSWVFAKGSVLGRPRQAHSKSCFEWELFLCSVFV